MSFRLFSHLGAATVAATIGVTTLPALAVVDCNLGGSVQREIDTGQSFIQFTGTCDEQLFVFKDGVSVQGVSGDRANDVISQGVLVLGANRTNFSDLTIKGLGGGSVSVQSSGDADFSNVVLSDLSSIFLVSNASASIRDNSRLENLTGSVVVVGGAAIDIDATTIKSLGGSLIVGDGSTAEISNTTIEDLGRGLSFNNGSTVTMFDSSVTDTNNGTFVVRGTNLTLTRTTLGPARIDDGNLSANPLSIGDNSNVRINNSTITGTTSDPIVGGAISLFRDSSVVLRGSNVVTNTGTEPAIGVFSDSSFRQGDPFDSGTATITGGILVDEASVFDLREAVVNGDVNVSLHSLLRVGSTSFGGDASLIRFNGNISVAEDSAMAVRAPGVVVNGNLSCADRESSVSGDFQVTGTIRRCTGFSGRRFGAGGGDD